MDAKSLAKSKRAHSQHHKKSHPRSHYPTTNPNKTTPKPKLSTNTNNPSSSNQSQAQTLSIAKHGLNSNWDRYNDDDEVADVGVGPSKQDHSDVVLPKSKGGDFSYLVSEAKGQLSPDFDDVTEFHKGTSAMLGVRGRNVLLWIGDDSFVVDDESTTGFETSFFSMDLNALAAQLEKLDVSQRLFIEPDMLPPELHLNELERTIKKEAKPEEVSESEPAKIYTETISVDSNANMDCKVVVEQSELVDQETPSGIPGLPFGEARCTNPIKNNTVKFGIIDLEKVTKSITELDINTSMEPKERAVPFKALAVEEELDMLLNSFGRDTKKPIKTLKDTKCDNSPSFLDALPSVSACRVPNYSTNTPTISILEETIDDLLGDTSDVRNQMQSSLRREKTTTPLDIPVTSSNPVTKLALDDFDSWLDTI